MGACGDDEPGTCQPGSVKTCALQCGDSTGIQVCADDGKSYDACSCEGVTPDAGAGGSGNVPVPSTAAIGAACDSDEQCTAGLRCLLASGNDFGTANSPLAGGPAGGYCTMDCTDAAECQAVDSASDCQPINDSGSAVCLRTCLSKDPRPGENKCLNRSTLACNSVAFLGFTGFALSRQNGWCLPLCGSDADCGGRVCNLNTGRCSDTPAEGLPIGALCNLDAPEACAGAICLPVTETTGVCSATCRFSSVSAGTASGCGYGAMADPREAACLYPLIGISTQTSESSEGFGDIGICIELCDVPADCGQPGWRCITEVGLDALLGRPGYCLPPVAGQTPDAGGQEPADAAVSPADGG